MTIAVQGCAGLCSRRVIIKSRADTRFVQGVQGVPGSAHTHVSISRPVMTTQEKIISRVESSPNPAHPAHPAQSQINQWFQPFTIFG